MNDERRDEGETEGKRFKGEYREQKKRGRRTRQRNTKWKAGLRKRVKMYVDVHKKFFWSTGWKELMGIFYWESSSKLNPAEICIISLKLKSEEGFYFPPFNWGVMTSLD